MPWSYTFSLCISIKLASAVYNTVSTSTINHHVLEVKWTKCSYVIGSCFFVCVIDAPFCLSKEQTCRSLQWWTVFFFIFASWAFVHVLEASVSESLFFGRFGAFVAIKRIIEVTTTITNIRNTWEVTTFRCTVLLVRLLKYVTCVVAFFFVFHNA